MQQPFFVSPIFQPVFLMPPLDASFGLHLFICIGIVDVVFILR